MNKTRAIFFLFTAILIGCSNAPLNLEIAKQRVVKYYDSGKYDSDLDEIVKQAENKFGSIKPGDSTVVVFDIDETIFSSYEFEKQIGFGYVESMWYNYIMESKDPLIKQTKSLYDFLLSKGFKIIFLTGRNADQYDATYKNLIYDGFTKFDTLIVRQPAEYDFTALKFKSIKRVELTNKGYNIAGTIGDQYSDLEGPDHGVQVKIPNYIYLIK